VNTRGRLISGLVTTVMALAGFVTAGTLPAAATASTVQYVALGDSYAAGVGATIVTPQPCGRSGNGYPELLDDQGRIGPVDNVACFGATTSIVADTQVSKLEPDTRLVTLTVGGNDLGFVGLAGPCLSGGLDTTECLAAIYKAVADDRLSDLDRNLTGLFTQVASAAPDARIVVTGYPILFEPGDPDHPSDFSPELVINPVNEAGARLNETIEDAVAAANDDGNIYYVDVTEEFAGHGVLKLINDPTATEPVDPSAFIHSPFICAPTTNPLCQNLAAAYHPTDKGYHAYANAISAALPRGWLNKQGLSA
jgi:lysophospholipase L1-like esterase